MVVVCGMLQTTPDTLYFSVIPLVKLLLIIVVIFNQSPVIISILDQALQNWAWDEASIAGVIAHFKQLLAASNVLLWRSIPNFMKKSMYTLKIYTLL